MKKMFILTLAVVMLFVFGSLASAMVTEEPIEGEVTITSISLEDATAIENGVESDPISEVRITAVGVEADGEVVATGAKEAGRNNMIYMAGAGILVLSALFFTKKRKLALN